MLEEQSVKDIDFHHEPSAPKSKSVFDHLKLKMRRKHTPIHDTSNLHNDVTNENLDRTISNNNQVYDELGSFNNKENSISIRFHRSTSSLTFLNDSIRDDNNTIEKKNKQNEYEKNNAENVISPKENSEINHVEKSSLLPIQSESYSTNKKHDEISIKLIKGVNSALNVHQQSKSKSKRRKLQTTTFQNSDTSFHIIFNDLPEHEHLIIAYPCAWRKDVFMHGRVFLSSNYLSFYACFLKWEESKRIPYIDIIGIGRDKSSLVIPNAIKIRTKTDEEYLFACYAPREKVFVAILRIWQNVLIGRPFNDQQLRTAICADQHDVSESSSEHEEFVNVEDINQECHKLKDTSQSLNVILYNQKESYSPSSFSTPSTLRLVQSCGEIISSRSVEERIGYPLKCSCESHLAKTYVDRIFKMNVDTLYDLIFGDNQCTRDFFDSQKFLNYNFGEWTTNSETGKRERSVTYNTINQSMLGTNVIQCREKHIVEEENPKVVYVLTTEFYSEGMRYADTFYILTRFCLVQCDAEHTSLLITAEPRFIKYVIGFVKTIMEKSIISSIQSELNERVRRLTIQPIKETNCESIRKEISQSETYLHEAINVTTTQEQTKEIQNANPVESVLAPIIEKVKPEYITIYDNRQFNLTLVFGILFLLSHAFLWYKLFSTERNIVIPDGFCSHYCKDAGNQNV